MPYRGENPSWAHALQSKGVPVESIGKLHYRSVDDPTGFDAMHMPMMVKNGIGPVFMSLRREGERYSNPNRQIGEYVGPGTSKYTEYDAAVTARTEAWLAEKAEATESWCLYVGLVAPHFPLVCPQDFYDLYPADSIPAPKLHPNTGYKRHPWVERQNAFADVEASFLDETERLSAFQAYYGLVSWLDHNIGRILTALGNAGFAENTTVVYASDHGDNVGARGLWGKSNMYEESAAVPLMMAGPGIPAGKNDTPVSLLDLTETILEHFDATLDADRPGRSLYDTLARPEPDRAVFSEYHATGAVTGAFMLRKGCYKLIHYVGFDPELFDLIADPQELTNLAADPAYRDTLAELQYDLYAICDPEAVDARAHADQAALIAAYGGRDRVIRETVGAGGGTPPPVTN